MTESQTEALISSQHRRFSEYGIPPVSVRRQALKNLRAAVLKNEEAIDEALRLDLGKSRSESFMSETGMFLSEVNWLIKHIGRLAKEKTVPTPP